MKVLMIFTLFLVCSTQALFLKHFQKKLNAISGWFSTEQLERSDQQEHGEDAGPDQNELFKVSRRREEPEPETESSESKPERSGIRESRCRTVDTKIPRDQCKDLQTCPHPGDCKTVTVCERFYTSVRKISCD